MIKDLYSKFLTSTGISTDTRKINLDNIFFALKGPNFNGNKYASVAIKAGAAYVVVDEAAYAIGDKYILVDDVLDTLQRLANYHRRQLNIPIIGIAGSNGKTTTKELTHAALSKKYKTFATKGNLNNHIGVPLTLLSIDSQIELAILELGANHVGELEFLCQIAEPTHGVITNNGLDHLEGYGNFEGVVRGNGELYDWLAQQHGTVFINSKDEILIKNSGRFKLPVLYGSQGDDFYAEIIDNQFFISVRTSKNVEFKTQLIGEYNLDNINAALCIAQHFDVPDLDAAKAIADYIPSNNRSQLVNKGTNHVILDCYNANPSSMIQSIESFSKINAKTKILILGDMYELGEYSEAEHQKIVDLVATKQITKVYLCGSDFEKTQTTDIRFIKFENRTLLEKNLQEDPIRNAAILIKGSRGMAMEKVIEWL